MSFSSLLLDIKLYIIEYVDCRTWAQIAMYDNEVRDYSIKNRTHYIEKYTVHEYNCDRNQTWKMFGKYHREPFNGMSRPADIYENTEMYYYNGKLHRERLNNEISWPAFITDYHEKYYYRGVKHRDYGLPAEIIGSYDRGYENRSSLYERDIHRIDDPFNREYKLYYYVNGLLHRDDINGQSLPAIVYSIDTLDMQEEYFQHGERYRSDNGPLLVFQYNQGYWIKQTRKDEVIIQYGDNTFTNIQPNKPKRIKRCKRRNSY